VEATALQVLAIESMMAAGLFDELSTEIRQSALLRLENPDISLTELAAQHVPQISKSGLNHRLSKVIDEARKRKLI
jgi:DNA-binding protein WhiA